MDAVREVVKEGAAEKNERRARSGMGKAMDAVRDVVNEEKSLPQSFRGAWSER